MDKLHEMTKAYKELMDMIAESESDEDLECINDTLDAINDAIEVKAENLAWIIEHLKAEKAYFEELERKARSAKQSREKQANRLKSYIDYAMSINGTKKLKAGAFSLFYVKSTPVEIIDQKQIPDEYMRVKLEPNKTAITEAIKKGISVPGATLVEKMNLNIRVK